MLRFKSFTIHILAAELNEWVYHSLFKLDKF